MRWIAIAAGGAAGAVCRWLIGYVFVNINLDGLPAATLTVNLVGAFLLGWLYGRVSEQVKQKAAYQGAAAGFLGAFTTMSAFGLESFLLVESGRLVAAALYILSSALLGPWLAWYGSRLGEAARLAAGGAEEHSL